MKSFLRSVPSEVRWAIAIGCAFHFPVLWGFLILTATWKAGGYLSLRHALWRQARKGPLVIEIDSRRFACWTHANGSHSVEEVQAAH